MAGFTEKYNVSKDIDLTCERKEEAQPYNFCLLG